MEIGDREYETKDRKPREVFTKSHTQPPPGHITMMTYSQPSAYNYDHYNASNLGKGAGSKQSRLSAEQQRYYGSPSSNSSHGSFSMTGSTANPRTLPPYISVQRASEPASPATIATTISSHSTPSPSPSRQSNMPNTASNADFTLFDDSLIAVAQDINSNIGKGRTALDVASTTSEGSSGLNSYASTGFPIILPHDASYSNYAHTGIYGNYPTNLYNLSQDQQVSQPQQQQQQQNVNKYLRPASYANLNNGSSNGATHASSSASHAFNDVEPIENVPALSPTSRQRSNNSPARVNVRPNSPRSPTGNANSQSSGVSNYAPMGSAYLHPAIPKLGRTVSDAVQDELYNPDLVLRNDQKSSQGGQRTSNVKSVGYQNSEASNENRTSFPHIFHEAQQRHQQDFSHNTAPQHHINRDRSPFRHNSPFHPTNNAPYRANYESADRGLSHSQLAQNIDQNQLAMAIALRDQMQKEAEQTVAPKTISPRESLLEYHEPENHQNQMNLFPPLQNNRMTAAHEDAISNGSLQGGSSHDGSDMDDFHSMATSRRGSMANSSVSSHLDVPRFGYMQQASYDNLSANPYYYTDSGSLAASMPINDPSVPYIKEEMDYNPIQRPLDTSANTGTYTCTYSGCGQRFTTSTKLQKHRREAHRKSAPSGNSVSSAAAIACRNAQPGPHRCMRVNPSTGKPCNTVFSRPYDLTRHEDTIHNSAKEKVRCEICNDEKTFSRADALVRHRRVKHNIS